MIKRGTTVSDDVLRVINYDNPVVAGAMANGQINTLEETRVANVASALKRGYPQVRPFQVRHDRICLVGSGPSLMDTESELRDLVFAGAKVVTLNGAYKWCLERNIKPGTQIVMDARPENASFVQPYVPGCRYLLASQCAPDVWDAVRGYSDVWMWHACMSDTGPVHDTLDRFYQGQWYGIGGGVTVATRAIELLNMCGYLRFDLFGIDSCWMPRFRLQRTGNGEYYPAFETTSRRLAETKRTELGGDWVVTGTGVHHAFPQPLNDADGYVKVDLAPEHAPELTRTFRCAPWHIKQIEDFVQLVRVNGSNMRVIAHGDGAIAHMFASYSASVGGLQAPRRESYPTMARPSAGSPEGQQHVGPSLEDLQPVEEEDRQHVVEPGVVGVSHHAPHVSE